MKTDKPRWQYRFDNYRKVYSLLQEISNRSQTEELEQIAKEGMIRRFKICMELAWKTIKDYMEHNGVVFAPVLPSVVLKEAGATKLIDNPEAWLQALDDRNKMSHTYSFEKSEQVIGRIATLYVGDCFGALYETLSQVMMGDE